MGRQGHRSAWSGWDWERISGGSWMDGTWVPRWLPTVIKLLLYYLVKVR